MERIGCFLWASGDQELSGYECGTGHRKCCSAWWVLLGSWALQSSELSQERGLDYQLLKGIVWVELHSVSAG